MRFFWLVLLTTINFYLINSNAAWDWFHARCTLKWLEFKTCAQPHGSLVYHKNGNAFMLQWRCGEPSFKYFNSTHLLTISPTIFVLEHIHQFQSLKNLKMVPLEWLHDWDSDGKDGERERERGGTRRRKRQMYRSQRKQISSDKLLCLLGLEWRRWKKERKGLIFLVDSRSVFSPSRLKWDRGRFLLQWKCSSE